METAIKTNWQIVSIKMRRLIILIDTICQFGLDLRFTSPFCTNKQVQILLWKSPLQKLRGERVNP